MRELRHEELEEGLAVDGGALGARSSARRPRREVIALVGSACAPQSTN